MKEGTVTREGFTLVGFTWSDSVVYGADVAWVATSSASMRFVTFAEPWGDFYAPLQNDQDIRHRKIEKELILAQPLYECLVQAVPTGLTHLDTDCSQYTRVQCLVESADRSMAKVSMTSWCNSITYMAHAGAVVAHCSADRQYVEVQCSNSTAQLPSIGLTVALYGTSACRFVQMRADGCVGILNEEVGADLIESTVRREWERFLVVDAGDGLVGLYCVFHRRFLHLWSDGGVNGGDRQIGQSESVPEYARFRIKVLEDGKVAVHSQVANRFLSVCTGDYLGHVDGHGGEKPFDALPDDWGDECFQVVMCAPPEQQQQGDSSAAAADAISSSAAAVASPPIISSSGSAPLNSVGGGGVSSSAAAATSSSSGSPALEPVALGCRNPSKKHIMMSYAWREDANPEHVKALADYLRGNGYDVWQDIEGSTICGKMADSIDEKMAEAVEKSAFVIVCISKAYPGSPRCKQEATYAHERENEKKLKIIYVMMQSDYTTDSNQPEYIEGLLRLYVGDRLWYPLWDKDQVESTGSGN